MKTIEQINQIINWLNDNNKSSNIVLLTQSLNKLSVLCVTLAQDVSDAYALMNELEDVYDDKYNSRFTELTAGKDKISAAAAKPQVEAELVEDKKNHTSAKGGYKKLSMYLDRVDRVNDSFRQYVAGLRDERKNSKGQV